MYNRKMFEIFIPYWEMENGEFMKRLEEISAPYGTEFKSENGVIICEL